MAWAGLDVRCDMSSPSAPLAFFTFMMLLAPVTNWEPHGVTLAGYCYAMRHGMKVQIVSLFRVIHLQRHGTDRNLQLHLAVSLFSPTHTTYPFRFILTHFITPNNIWLDRKLGNLQFAVYSSRCLCVPSCLVLGVCDVSGTLQWQCCEWHTFIIPLSQFLVKFVTPESTVAN
jgi:hypothetical protein